MKNSSLLELTKIKEELENGSIEAAPHNAMLTNFWEKLTESRKIQSLEKARCFINVFIESVHKHNKQFTSPELLFLASFGEFKTSTLVAKMMNGMNYVSEIGTTFESKMHGKTIDLYKFSEFLLHYCVGEVEEAITLNNFKYMEDTIRAIAIRTDIWDMRAETLVHQNQYRYQFSSLPLTNIMVERSVKKAKLFQQTGKVERNVTAWR